MTRFDDIVDTDGLDPAEELRLRKVHDLLLEAGPPPELPPALREPPSPHPAQVIPFPKLPPRRFGSVAVVAAAAVLAAFAAGYFLGHSKKTTFTAERVVVLHRPNAAGSALATLRIAKADAVGNWPMQLVVRGLPQQRARTAFYELWLTHGGRPVEPCGTFRVHGNDTTVSFTVPYEFHRGDGWVVTSQPSGDTTPGAVVLTT
ncbi:MAG TPA: anti-sigma factor [Gaiellaceae bacterium]|nr:anti-sigma factor [Gaiellaceae bacterium]